MSFCGQKYLNNKSYQWWHSLKRIYVQQNAPCLDNLTAVLYSTRTVLNESCTLGPTLYPVTRNSGAKCRVEKNSTNHKVDIVSGAQQWLQSQFFSIICLSLQFWSRQMLKNNEKATEGYGFYSLKCGVDCHICLVFKTADDIVVHANRWEWQPATLWGRFCRRCSCRFRSCCPYFCRNIYE